MSEMTYSCRVSPGADGLGHFPQDLVSVSGRVPGRFDALLGHVLAVHVELDAGGRDQDVQLDDKAHTQMLDWRTASEASDSILECLLHIWAPPPPPHAKNSAGTQQVAERFERKRSRKAQQAA